MGLARRLREFGYRGIRIDDRLASFTNYKPAQEGSGFKEMVTSGMLAGSLVYDGVWCIECQGGSNVLTWHGLLIHAALGRISALVPVTRNH